MSHAMIPVRLTAPLLLASLLSGCLGGAVRPPEGSGYRVRLDDATGWEVHEMWVGEGTPSERRVRICPAAGGNAFSLTAAGVELLRQPPSLDKLPGCGFGIPVLYPTPNRVRDGKFTFEGREFELPTNAGRHHIHGLVSRLEWEVGAMEVTEEGLCLPLSIEVKEGHPVYERFPLEHRVELRYTLSTRGLRVGVRIKNRDTRRLPFGFALHPYFRLLGARESTEILVPAAQRMENHRFELLPNGRLIDVDGTKYDLRAPVSLAELDLDDVYRGMVPEKPAIWESLDGGVAMSLEATEIFTHMVVYTPKDRDFFCLENQTCSTDAHNLYAKGLTDEAHLLILEPVGSPGSEVEGSVLLRVERLAVAAEPGESS